MGTERIVIQIPRWRPTSLNSLMNSHWAKAARMKKADKSMVAIYCSGMPKAKGKRRVTFNILLGKGQRRTDPDACLKSGLDALVACGMLVDDSDKYCEIMPVTQFRKPGWYGTLIALEDI